MSAIERLLSVIGYPADAVTSAGGRVVLQVDGRPIGVREERGRLVLSLALGNPSEDALRRLAGYAAGRLLREEAALAWDSAAGELVLWQEVPVGAAEDALRRAFEVFCASCDWWADRGSEGAAAAVPELLIRP